MNASTPHTTGETEKLVLCLSLGPGCPAQLSPALQTVVLCSGHSLGLSLSRICLDGGSSVSQGVDWLMGVCPHRMLVVRPWEGLSALEMPGAWGEAEGKEGKFYLSRSLFWDHLQFHH